jgi:hypothetical protein
MSKSEQPRGTTPGVPGTTRGSWKVQEHSVATGVGMEDVSDPFRPMTSHEFRTWGDDATKLRQLEVEALPVFLADGTTVEVTEYDGRTDQPIVEHGFYIIRDGNDRAIGAVEFKDLTLRGQIGDRIAQNAAIANRGQGASLDLETGAPLIHGEPFEDLQAPSSSETDIEALDQNARVDDPGSFWHGAEILHVYTREQAIADGALIDHTDLAKEAGFAYPVAMTAAVQADGVTWPEPGWQDEEGRAWDILNMASYAARRAPRPDEDPQRREFTVSRVPRGKSTPRDVNYVLHVGPGDDSKPVVTILMPNED